MTQPDAGVGVLIPAAGAGSRLGSAVPKAFVELAGVPLVVHACRGLRDADIGVRVLVLAVPDPAGAHERAVANLLATELPGVDVRLCAGGVERTDSVGSALQALTASPSASGLDCVLVHDAARPLTPPAMIARVVARVRAGADGVIPVLPVTDTVKVVEGDRVLDTPDRARLVAVQTPQGFRPEALQRAYTPVFASGGHTIATDDAALVERIGGDVRTVPGDPAAAKITTPADLIRAEATLAGVAR